MTSLTKPDTETAAAHQSRAEFDDRLIGVKMHGHKGNEQVNLYTLAEVAEFIGMAPMEALQQYGTKGMIHYVDPNALVEWLVTVQGDEELAAAVEAEIEAHGNYKDRIVPIKELLKERLEQIEER
ncbi:MAG: hypothetical protein ACQEQJ_09265 [Halobacteriota archaeon]